jgi:hypothetical protein
VGAQPSSTVKTWLQKFQEPAADASAPVAALSQ